MDPETAGETVESGPVVEPEFSARLVDPPAARVPGGAVDSAETRAASPEEASEQPGITLADLSQEIRRVGRELFKTNRAAERNQELFESTLEELRQVSAAVAQAHAQSADPVFLAKAALCRELLGVADALEASTAAANEVLAQLRELAPQPADTRFAGARIAFRFPATQRLQAGLAGAVAAMGKWADGQQLLYERLMSALQSAGVRAMESVGRSFDPAW